MRHLYSSRVAVLRLDSTIVHGTPQLDWVKLGYIIDPDLGVPGELSCRIDLGFQRPGRDAPMAVVAGRAPDRIGIMFCDVTGDLRAGDRIDCLTGPVTGVFELRQTPDPAVDYGTAHHLEVQIVEVAQNMAGFPSAAPTPAV